MSKWEPLVGGDGAHLPLRHPRLPIVCCQPPGGVQASLRLPDLGIGAAEWKFQDLYQGMASAMPHEPIQFVIRADAA